MKLRFRSHALLWMAIALSLALPCFAQQQIPLGTWRLHLAYTNISSLATGDGLVFGATASGILVLNKNDFTITSYNTLNALTTTGISALAYDGDRQQLLVGYEDGNLDIITDEERMNFSRLSEAGAVTGSRRINHISIREEMAYLSTDFGIAVFNLNTLELKETWRDLGESGERVAVLNTTFSGNRIFAATTNGVIEGALDQNLLDYNQWAHYNEDAFGTTVQSVAAFDGSVFATLDNEDLFRLDNGAWIATGLFPGADFHTMYSGTGELLVTEGASLWTVNAALQRARVNSPLITAPHAVASLANGEYWIGDTSNGLVGNVSGEFESFVPNGPSASVVSRMSFTGDDLYAVRGGFQNGQPKGSPGIVDVFHNGVWSSVTLPVSDVTDVAFGNGYQYVSSFGGGVVRFREGDTVIFNRDNSPFDEETITAIEFSGDALWAIEYGASPGIHRLQGEQWTSFSTLASQVTDLVIDHQGDLWLLPDPGAGTGLIAFDPDASQSRYITTGQGAGGLPSARVNAMTVDKEGYVWVGTDAGVAYFYASNEDAILPIYEGRYLLQNEEITAIEVDGGNRKWIATNRGVWLFNDTGEILVRNFTSTNSPLLSDTLTDIEIDPHTGEVFFATDKGVISYRSDATEGDASQGIRIFPNPVASGFSGTVGIGGLPSDAIVKITDISGKLIWQTRANGGTATWNLRDYNGRRATIGVYLVFAASEDAANRVVGKIAVVD